MNPPSVRSRTTNSHTFSSLLITNTMDLSRVYSSTHSGGKDGRIRVGTGTKHTLIRWILSALSRKDMFSRSRNAHPVGYLTVLIHVTTGAVHMPSMPNYSGYKTSKTAALKFFEAVQTQNVHPGYNSLPYNDSPTLKLAVKRCCIKIHPLSINNCLVPQWHTINQIR